MPLTFGPRSEVTMILWRTTGSLASILLFVALVGLAQPAANEDREPSENAGIPSPLVSLIAILQPGGGIGLGTAQRVFLEPSENAMIPSSSVSPYQCYQKCWPGLICSSGCPIGIVS